MSLSLFHPAVARWFSEAIGKPTRAQVDGWRAIRERRDTLIAAPTGSGKTLAAFLSALDELFAEGLTCAAPRRSSRCLRFAAQGAERGHPQEPRGAAARDPGGCASDRTRCAGNHGRRAHRRHDAIRAGGDAAQAAAHSRHDSGVAVSAAHREAKPRAAADRAHRHRRRDSRRDRDAARRPSCR